MERSDDMTNKEIAKVFYDIGDILEIKGESVFKVIAYRNAARSLEFLPDDVNEVYKVGSLKALEQIPGVGVSIAEKIEELIKTGKLKYYDEIKKEIPPVTLELTKIPNVGPKTAQKLYEKLKVKNTEELAKALDTPKAGKFFQQKTRERIKTGIELLKRLSGRIILPFAEPIAREFVGTLKNCPGVLKVDPVGSLRRMRETVGDVDIVCAAREPKKAIDCFVSHTKVREVISKGATKATVIHEDGIQIDLEILPQEKYGSLLQHFTGGKEHNVALRTWGVEHGFSISEHGIKKRGKLHLFEHEEDVYKFLGMDWIPPELRENRGEIEAALKLKLPKLIDLKDIRGDLQTHSTWSDGNNTIEAMVESAIKHGYEYFAITDHTKGLGVAHGLDEKRVKARHKEIEQVRKKLGSKIHILEGLEVDIRADGHLDLSDDTLKEMDIVVASIHSAFAQPKGQITQRLVGAIQNPHVDILGHPSGRLLGQREAYPVEWDDVFQAAAKTGVALEIDAFPNRLDLSDVLAREARRQGAWIIIDTDAHKIEQLSMMGYGVSTARRAWLTKPDVLNTRSWKGFSEWLERAR
jgi:DNA polymerase (family 10)